MTTEQRKYVLKRFDSAKVKNPACPRSSSRSLASSSSHPKKLSIAAKDSGITVIPIATLDFMWSKADEYLLSSTSVLPAPGNDPKSKMVMSRSSPTPHFVRVISPGQYVCDKQCLQWSSSKICSHILVAAEVNGELLQFLQWYVRSNQEPNITKLAHVGLPSGRGRKGGIPKRKRSKTPAYTPGIVVPRPATVSTAGNVSQRLAAVSSAHSSMTVEMFNSSTDAAHAVGRGSAGGTTAILQQAGRQPLPAVSNLQSTTSPMQPTANVIPGSSSQPATVHSTMVAHNSQVMQAVNTDLSYGGQQLQVIPGPSIPAPLGTDTALHSAAPLPNTNPFYVRFIEGNIRMCQGCKSFLRNAHGVVPTAPFNLCAARAERRSFRNVAGVLVTPRKEQPAHYHLNLACIRAVAPQFVPSSLVIPSDVRPKLTQTHQEYLRLVFGLC